MKKKTYLISLAVLAFSAIALVAAEPPQAATNWENSCASCHGSDGKGQTKVGKRLKLKDYTDAKALAEFTDEQLFIATADGVKNEAGKEVMKGYRDELSEPEIRDLVRYIRAMAK